MKRTVLLLRSAVLFVFYLLSKVMRFLYLLFLFISTIFFGCQTKEQEKASKEIIFDLEDNVEKYKIQSYYDKKTKADYLYFTDTHNGNVIKFFDMQGTLLEKVPLNSALAALQKIESLRVVSLDTILIYSNTDNKLFFINRKGEVWKRLMLSPILRDEKGNRFSIGYVQISENNGLSLISPVFFIDNEHKKRLPNQNDYLRDYAKNENTSPFICKITNLFEANPKVIWGFRNFYQKLGNVEDWYIETRRISFVNNKLFFYSRFTDSLYQASQNLMIEKKTKISSIHTPVGQVKPIRTDDSSLQKSIKEQTYNILTKTAGYVNDVQYDALTDMYYVTVFHQIPFTTPEENQGNEKRSFSVCVLDKELKKIKEYFFDNKTYNPYPIATQKGLFLIKKTPTFSPKNKSKAHEKVTITPFYFNK